MEKDGSQLNDVLARVDELRVFPSVALKIQKTASDPDASIINLGEVVRMDPTLSARLLKIANSPFYGLRREVSSLEQALFVLGFEATRNLALGLIVAALASRGDKTQEMLWQHSLRCGAAAQILTTKLDFSLDSSAAFVVGLMQDMGSLILVHAEKRRYQHLLTTHALSEPAFLAAELTEFGFTHSELGSACLRRWNLPQQIVDLVRYHHTPSAAPSTELINLAEVFLFGDYLARAHHYKASRPIEDQLALAFNQTPNLAKHLDLEDAIVIEEELDERSSHWAELLA